MGDEDDSYSTKARSGVDERRVYRLSPGKTLIGSHPSADIYLPVSGVANIHVLIIVSLPTVRIEDMASKNGTFLNGDRIASAALKPGDVLSVGAATLRLDNESGDLALVIHPEVVCEEILQSSQKTQSIEKVTLTSSASALGKLEKILNRLSISPTDAIADALGFVAIECEARGAVVGWYSNTEGTRILAGCGDMRIICVRQERVQSFFQEVWQYGSSDGKFATAIFKGQPSLLCAGLSCPGKGVLGTVLWESSRQSVSNRHMLLQLFLRLIAKLDHSAEAGHISDIAKRDARKYPTGYIPGQSNKMRILHHKISQMASSNIPLLVLGETGVGKEHIADLIHQWSTRSPAPFVAVNCAAIPHDLLEAEMFGIGKGVATGVAARKGKFQAAQGGTLFLDEIGDMPFALQAKLLRALDNKEIQPVGSPAVKIDVRIVSATNVDLQHRIEKGSFRADLFYRLAGATLQVPPLRERNEDISLFLLQFVQRYSKKLSKLIRGINIKVLELLAQYSWPGNIRELEQEAQRLVHQCAENQAIDSSMLSEHILKALQQPSYPKQCDDSLLIEERVQELEAALIREALVRARGNRTEAAKLLGISRNGLAMKIHRLGVEAKS